MGARDEYTYLVSGTECTIRVVNQPDKPQPPQPEKPNQNNDKGDNQADKQDNQERDRNEKLTGLDDSSSNGEYDLSNLANDDLAQWLEQQLRDAELNTPQSEFDKDSLLACYGCPSEMQPTWIAQVIASGDADLIASTLGISATAAAVIAQNAQNGASDADIAKQVRQAQATGGAMPPNRNNGDDKNNNKRDKETEKKIDNLLKDTKKGDKTSGKARQYEKAGDFETAKQDFYSLNPKNVKSRGENKITGELPDGRQVNVRVESSDNRPTLEIQNTRNNFTKIRYGSK